MKKIFVVDDNLTILKLIQKTLENKYNNVYTFESGEQCIENMHLNPDIIFLDHYLSKDGLSGLETLIVIKKTNIGARIIILSGQEDPKIVKQYYDVGVDGYIIKDDDLIKSILETLCTYFGR